MKKIIKIVSVFLILMQFIVFSGCNAADETNKKSDRRIITDMLGRTVEIPTHIERIACQSSTCEAVIISLGKALLLVGTTDYIEEDSFAYQLYPELSKVDKLADDMSVEEMLEKDVQVVFVKDTNKIEKYEEAGLPVIYVDLDTVDGTKEGIQIIGDVIGAPNQAQKCVNYISEKEKLVTERLSDATDAAFTAYYSRAKYAESNLLTTYAASHIYSNWIGFSGGTVITKDMELAETKGGVTINGEELISADPDVIFIGGYYRNDVYQTAMSGEYSGLLSAIREKRMYLVPTSVTDWSVGSCELGLVTLWCAQQVAPDLFADVDMVQEIILFYKEISNIDVSEDLARAILNSNEDG